MRINTGGTQPPFIEQSAVMLSELGTNPLFAISIEKLEPIFKTWVWQVLNEIQPDEKTVKYLTRAEASKKLRISLPTLTKYIDMGIVSACQVGTRVLIRDDELDEALIKKTKFHE
jgi:excisionase family DNA binding protein